MQAKSMCFTLYYHYNSAIIIVQHLFLETNVITVL